MKLFDFSTNLYTPYTPIKPSTAGAGEFITYYHLDPDGIASIDSTRAE